MSHGYREKIASGKIRNIGFSYHGNTENFQSVVDAYDWDFCQIQYNYLDENIQAGRKGLLYASEKNLPVIIMEPLRGGRLVGMLPETAKKRIARSDVNESAASLALRWLYDQPQVTVCVIWHELNGDGKRKYKDGIRCGAGLPKC